MGERGKMVQGKVTVSLLDPEIITGITNEKLQLIVRTLNIDSPFTAEDLKNWIKSCQINGGKAVNFLKENTSEGIQKTKSLIDVSIKNGEVVLLQIKDKMTQIKEIELTPQGKMVVVFSLAGILAFMTARLLKSQKKFLSLSPSKIAKNVESTVENFKKDLSLVEIRLDTVESSCKLISKTAESLQKSIDDISFRHAQMSAQIAGQEQTLITVVQKLSKQQDINNEIHDALEKMIMESKGSRKIFALDNNLSKLVSDQVMDIIQTRLPEIIKPIKDELNKTSEAVFKMAEKQIAQEEIMNQTVEDIHEYVSDNIQSVKNQMNQFENQNRSFATGDFADPKE